MIPFLDHLVALAEWLFKTSLKASVLVALILITQFLLRRKLSARWQYALWFLLIIRLVLPFDIESRFSLFRLVPLPATQSVDLSEPSNAISRLPLRPAQFPPQVIAARDEVEIAADHHRSQLSVAQKLALGWLLGLVLILLYTVITNVRLWLRIRLRATASSPILVRLLEECKNQMKIARQVAIVDVPGIRIPVLFGIVQPKILMPVNFAQQMGTDQIRHIFFHELAHYKRKDVLVSCLTTILQIIHWFNPVIWLAFYRMRLDRELACDELTLNRIGASQCRSYGLTIISLLEGLTGDRSRPLTVGIIESKQNIKQRLAMIANFKTRPLIWTVVGAGLLIAVGALALTDAPLPAPNSTLVIRQPADAPEPAIPAMAIQNAGEPQRNKSISPPGPADSLKESRHHQILKKQPAIDHTPEYRSEVIIAFSASGVTVDGEVIDVDSLARKLQRFRFDQNSVITLKPAPNTDMNSWMHVQMQLQSVPVQRLKYVNATTGKAIITPQYELAKEHGLVIPKLNPRRINGKVGYWNRNFRMVIPPRFDDVGLFQEDLANVKIGEKWGFIDTSGTVVIEPQFDLVRPFYEGLAAVMIGTKWGFINKTGQMVIEPTFESANRFDAGLALVTLNRKHGFIDRNGAFAIPPIFDHAYEFTEGLAAVRQDGKWGFINQQGEFVIPRQFELADRFSNGLALVKINGKFGYIDRAGKFIIPPHYEHAESFSEGLAAVQVNGKYGYIDGTGQMVIEPQFDSAGDFMAGLAHVIIFERPELKIKGQGFEIDKAGNIIGPR